jgi:hypothetical protein
LRRWQWVIGGVWWVGPSFLISLLLSCACAALGAQTAGDGSSAPRGKTPDLAGTRVTIHLRTGKVLSEVEVLELRGGKVAGTVSSLTITGTAPGQHTTLGAAAVQQIIAADGTCWLRYDEAAKILVPPDAANLDEIRKAAEQAKVVPQERPIPPAHPPKPASRPRDPAKEDDRRPSPDPPRPPEDEAARTTFPQRTGLQTGLAWWPALTGRQQEAAVAEMKQYLEKVRAAFAADNLRLYETQYFLFLSDLPPQQVAVITPSLDTMYHELCKAFGIASGTNIWRGKAAVVAFVEPQAFQQFERQFFHNDHETAPAVAHQGGAGTVIIACHRGDDPVFFATTLVHETAHGFLHRYKSPRVIPSWLNEGAAEWIAAAVVTAGTSVPQRQQRAIAQVHETGTLGGDFFTVENIHDWQYGIASSLTDFLLRTDPKRYRRLIEGIKDGLSWQDSLQRSYGLTPEQLTQRYGASIGVPALKP